MLTYLKTRTTALDVGEIGVKAFTDFGIGYLDRLIKIYKENAGLVEALTAPPAAYAGRTYENHAWKMNKVGKWSASKT